MARLLGIVGLVLLPVSLAIPAQAGLNQDLKSCSAADNVSSIDACTRVLLSGNLRNDHRYVAHFNRGWAHRNAGQYDKALADFEKSASYNPSYADTYYSLAVIHHDKGNKTQALKSLDRYLDAQKDKQRGHYMRAVMFRKLGEPDRALEDLDKAEQYKTSGAKEKTVRALALADKGDYSEAQVAADDAISASPKSADAHLARAVVMHKRKWLAAAVISAKKAIELQDTFPSAHTLLGRIYEDQGNITDAKASYERAIASQSKNIDGNPAKSEARDRLAKLNGDGDHSSDSVGRVAEARTGECHRFIREMGKVMPVECGQ